ncbi:MAG: hypothetical protein ACI4WV_05090 [Eubacteriales bacterium]
MYSRIPRKPPRPFGEPSYRRPVTPPPNYSGNAFPTQPPADDLPDRDDLPDLPDGDALPIRQPENGQDTVTPRFGDLPRVSTLPGGQGRNSLWQEDKDMEPEPIYDTYGTGTDTPGEDWDRDSHFPGGEGSPPAIALPARQEPAQQVACDTVPASPSLFSHTHFPLGHGLGQEELLILGLLLFLLHEDGAEGKSGDNDLAETLLLLGILLFCG